MSEYLENAQIALKAREWDRVKSLARLHIAEHGDAAEAYLYMLLADMHAESVPQLSYCDTDFTTNANYLKFLELADKYMRKDVEEAAKDAKSRLGDFSKGDDNSVYEGQTNSGVTLSNGRTESKYKSGTSPSAASYAGYGTAKRENGISSKNVIAVAIVIAIIGLAIWGIVEISRASANRQYEYSSERILMEVTGKENLSKSYSSIDCKYYLTITNTSKNDITTIYGMFIVCDADGNVLNRVESSFKGDIKSGSGTNWYLDVYMEESDGAYEVWDCTLEELTVCYQVTRVDYANGRTKEFNVKPVLIKEIE